MAESLGGNYVASDEYQSSLQGSRMSDSLRMACDYYYDPFCEVCFESRNRNVKHDGFCKDCVQFLCEDCLRVHRKLQGTRGHVIQSGDDMPKSMADKPPKFDYCNAHQGSRKDQFCSTHKVLLCIQCVQLQHIGCPVESVENTCKGIPSSEIGVLYDKVSDFKTNLTSVVAHIDLNISELGKQTEELLQEARDMKDRAIAKIEKLFQEITSEAESTSKTYKSELDHSRNKLNGVIVNVRGALDEINKLKGNTLDTKVFLKIQDILKDVEQCKSDAKLLQPSMNVNMTFIPDKRMNEFLSSSFKVGSVSLGASKPQFAISEIEITFPMSIAQSLPLTQGRSDITSAGANSQVAEMWTPHSLIKAQKLTSYNIMFDYDANDCCVSGIVVTNDGRRLLVDFNNCKIKLFTPDMKSVCSLSLSTRPYDVAVTGDREAVVSCYNEAKLLIVDISDKISIKEIITLPFTVRGISPYKDKLFVTSVSSSRPSVKLIDQNGRVYWSTDTDQQGRQLFSRPWYVNCYDYGESPAVIVSDNNNTLTMLNADTGDVITRRQVKWKGPEGVTIDMNGNIYVCYHSTCEVAVLAKDLLQEKILLSTRDGLSKYPKAIVYNVVDHKLLISNMSEYYSNTVDCFQLQ